MKHPKIAIIVPVVCLVLVWREAAGGQPCETWEKDRCDDTRQSSDTLEEIIITATRIERPVERVPAAVSVVPKDDIQLARQQLGLDESLTRVPGLFMQNRYNFAQDLRLAIRGFGARGNFGIRGVKILVDGFPETLPDGQGSVDSISIGTTGQIEVIRGPSSSLYGNASGGVISMTSEAPPDDEQAQLRLTAGSYDFFNLQARLGGKTDRLGYLFTLSGSEIDGYREQSRAENKQLTGRLDFDLGDERELLAVFSFTDQPVSEDPGGVVEAQAALDPRSANALNVLFDAGESLDQSRLGLLYTMPLGEDHEISARSYFVSRDFANRLPFVSGGQVDLDRLFIGGHFSYRYSGEVGGFENEFLIGIDFDLQDDDRRRFDNKHGMRGGLVFDQNETVGSLGVYVQDLLTLSESVTLNLGLRFDEVEFDVSDHYLIDGDDSGVRKLDDVSPMFGITRALTGRTSIYGNYSTAFETPTTTEFANPDSSGGFNPSLEPQTARNLEVGVRGLVKDRHRYELAIFNIEVDDELVSYELAEFPGKDFFRNAASSSRKGVEFSLVSEITDHISTTLSWTYSDFHFDDFPIFDDTDNVIDNFAGNVIPGPAEKMFFGEIRYAHPRGWFAALDALYVGEQYADNANTTLVDSYVVSNLRFGAELDLDSLRVSPFIGVNNLFDESYNSNIRINAFGARYYEPAPDRNIYGGVNVMYIFN